MATEVGDRTLPWTVLERTYPGSQGNSRMLPARWRGLSLTTVGSMCTGWGWGVGGWEMEDRLMLSFGYSALAPGSVPPPSPGCALLQSMGCVLYLVMTFGLCGLGKY